MTQIFASDSKRESPPVFARRVETAKRTQSGYTPLAHRPRAQRPGNKSTGQGVDVAIKLEGIFSRLAADVSPPGCSSKKKPALIFEVT